ncbi:MAG: hypothetical protein ACN4GZ_01120 [Acidimicrobiales bacterium]
MNAALAVPAPDLTTSADHHNEEEVGFWAIQARTMTAAIAVTMAFAAAVIYPIIEEIVPTIGLALFCAFWLGGGFGFLVGGVLWGLNQEEH